jgi:regulator of RNase E activity RraB
MAHSSFDYNRNLESEATARVFRMAERFDLKTKPQQEVEFFFYANTQDAASNLAIDLSKLGYNVYQVDTSAANKNKWLVSGCTLPLNMTEVSLIKWSEGMCRLASLHDCQFDGWGTLMDGDS